MVTMAFRVAKFTDNLSKATTHVFPAQIIRIILKCRPEYPLSMAKLFTIANEFSEVLKSKVKQQIRKILSYIHTNFERNTSSTFFLLYYIS